MAPADEMAAAAAAAAERKVASASSESSGSDVAIVPQFVEEGGGGGGPARAGSLEGATRGASLSSNSSRSYSCGRDPAWMRASVCSIDGSEEGGAASPRIPLAPLPAFPFGNEGSEATLCPSIKQCWFSTNLDWRGFEGRRAVILSAARKRYVDQFIMEIGVGVRQVPSLHNGPDPAVTRLTMRALHTNSKLLAEMEAARDRHERGRRSTAHSRNQSMTDDPCGTHSVSRIACFDETGGTGDLEELMDDRASLPSDLDG